MLDADLDLHGSSLVSDASVVVGEGVAADAAPGQPRDQGGGVGLRDAARSASQNRALTWAIPTSDDREQPGRLVGRPVSSWITAAIMAAHSVVTRSTCSRTAGSLVRSDSKTRRKAPVSLAT